MAGRIKITGVWTPRISTWDDPQHGESQSAKIYARDERGRVWRHSAFGAEDTELYHWEGTIRELIARMRKVGSINPERWTCVDPLGDAGEPDWAWTTPNLEMHDANS